jgi:hypothetical protein
MMTSTAPAITPSMNRSDVKPPSMAFLPSSVTV